MAQSQIGDAGGTGSALPLGLKVWEWLPEPPFTLRMG